MDAWAIFWAVVLIAVLVVFTVVAVIVGIGGFGDVKAMFRNIDEQHEEDSSKDGKN